MGDVHTGREKWGERDIFGSMEDAHKGREKRGEREMFGRVWQISRKGRNNPWYYQIFPLHIALWG